MQIQSEAPPGPARERAARSVAFGLPIEVDPGIEIPGIPNVDAPWPTFRPPTRVRLDPGELERRWSASAEQAPERMREMRDGETVLLTVELALPAGYLLHVPGFGRILIAPDGTELICDPEPGSSQW